MPTKIPTTAAGVNISIFERPSGREEFPKIGSSGKSFWWGAAPLETLPQFYEMHLSETDVSLKNKLYIIGVFTLYTKK